MAYYTGAVIEITTSGLQDAFETARDYNRKPIMIDADLLAWFESKGDDATAQINDLVRFYRDSSEQKAAQFDPDACEPGEMAEPAPAP